MLEPLVDHVQETVKLYARRRNLEKEVTALTAHIDNRVKTFTDSQVRAYEALKALVGVPPQKPQEDQGGA